MGGTWQGLELASCWSIKDLSGSEGREGKGRFSDCKSKTINRNNLSAEDTDGVMGRAANHYSHSHR